MAHTFELEPTKLVRKGGAGPVLSYITLKHWRTHEDGSIQISFDCFGTSEIENEIDRLIKELQNIKKKTNKLYAK